MMLCIDPIDPIQDVAMWESFNWRCDVDANDGVIENGNKSGEGVGLHHQQRIRIQQNTTISAGFNVIIANV